jgi:DNA-binding transcriptional MerR regulator
MSTSPVVAGRDVRSVTGATERQLQSWTSRGLIGPPTVKARRSGQSHHYAPEQVLQIAVASRLRRLGVRLEMVARMMSVMADTTVPTDDLILVAFRDEVMATGDPDDVLKLIGAGHAVLAIAVGQVAASLRDSGLAVAA